MKLKLVILAVLVAIVGTEWLCLYYLTHVPSRHVFFIQVSQPQRPALIKIVPQAKDAHPHE